MKKQAAQNKAQERKPLYKRADTKAYKVFLVILSLLVLYVVSLLFAVRKDDVELLIGLGISQIPLYAAWIVLLVGRIRFLCVNKQRPAPIKAIKSFIMWWRRFLALYRAKFHAAPEDGNWIEEKISAYNKNSARFYSGGEMGDDVTQYYRNLLRLHRKRLDGMGIRLESKRKRMVLEESMPVRYTVTNDGKLRSIHAEEHIIGNDTFYNGSKKLFSRKMKGCMHYEIIGAVGGNAPFSCPNCGNAAVIKEFIDGCPYCGSKVLLENLGDRIGDCHFFRDPEVEIKKSRIRISEWANRLVFMLVIFEFVAMSISFGGYIISETDVLPFAIVLTVLTMLMFFGMLFVMARIAVAPFKLLVRAIYTKLRQKHSKDMQLARRNTEMLAKVHTYNKDFSLHAFFGNVQNKLAAIHYAENEKQVGVYTAVDLSAYIRQYGNVADCRFENMELKSYDLRGDREKVGVDTVLRLMFFADGKVSFRREKLSLTLERNSGRERKTLYGVHIPICGKCGAPVDLLNGNICAWCGTNLNAGNIDWCITAYRSEL